LGRNILIITLFLLATVGGYGQREKVQNLPEYDYEPYHFGFLLGVNSMDFSIKQNYPSLGTALYPATKYLSKNADSYAVLKAVEPVPTTGFSIGIIGNLRLSDHFDLRAIPTLSFGERRLDYHYYEYNPSDKTTDTTSWSASIKSTFLELPIHIKYKGNRINNARPYIIGGAKLVQDLSSDAKKKAKAPNEDISDIALGRRDLYGEIGAGFDFYFEWFKMGVEAKMSYGLRDILYRDNTMYTRSIDRLNSKIFQLSITFE
jgi:hypothetical protein